MNNDKKHKDSLLAAEYAAGILSASDAQEFERRLSTDSALTGEYEYWVERLGELSSQSPESMSPTVWRALIRKAIEDDDKVNVLPRTRFKKRFTWLALMVFFITCAIWLVSPTQFKAKYQTQIVAIEEGIKLNVQFDDVTDRIRISPIEGRIADNKDLELWAIVGRDEPVSLGVTDLSETQIKAIDPAIVNSISVLRVIITEEAKGGSRSGVPSGELMAVGYVQPR
ncbi:anti-sigma factor [Marinomonas mediterranea]|jgi:Uncharacterized protein conserved in bacteria|uniref:Anti-sigma-K factor RskA n=1 Tax=Marinomonas mediterranea (strain ATCC 700492 / JCM 21426 / NBRC 103028 / MMB-1) TaxID=717774 RepID=F2K000_MARM1|nr:anti-sigma-K factor RskA [Marinomonas mediterranea]ADZ92112.1 Anti-sigma-K factor RskA [Marinomonas mediterranea MMB-1]WCN10073.1 hypothetical protein GV055_14695 [Marinomonas mediterranea]WCN14124.1 hypothetical protein GV054_14520 [Marinomonas mediterranea]WCN18179.1 hypothetical protein GV053_14610 [Marinomonas mediterranea MMB-1]